MNITKLSKVELPAYIELIYDDIYKNMDTCLNQDSSLLCSVKTFFQYRGLVDALTRELKKNQKVLQLGAVFGNQIDEVAMALSANGQYDIVDINPLQVSRITDKYWKVYPCIKVHCQNAAELKLKDKYDAVICFMLLSEVPSATKTKIINNALKMVKPGGKVIFIDWHRPLFTHPLRYLVRMHNRLYHPFVEKLWDRDIDTYALSELRSQFIWRKNTYFGRMFQKTVAVRKTDPVQEEKESNFFETALGTVEPS